MYICLHFFHTIDLSYYPKLRRWQPPKVPIPTSPAITTQYFIFTFFSENVIKTYRATTALIFFTPLPHRLLSVATITWRKTITKSNKLRCYHKLHQRSSSHGACQYSLKRGESSLFPRKKGVFVELEFLTFALFHCAISASFPRQRNIFLYLLISMYTHMYIHTIW